MLEFTKAIEEVVRDCKTYGRGQLIKKNRKGWVELYLSADWEPHPDGIHDVIVLYIHYTDTLNVAYSTILEDTKVRR